MEYHSTGSNRRLLSCWASTLLLSYSILFTAIPASLLVKRFGARAVQIIGGLMATVGMLATGFTTQAWQAMITNAIASGTRYLSACYIAIQSRF